MAETYHPRGELVHGFTPREHPIYNIWACMKTRCTNRNEPGYENYGGRVYLGSAKTIDEAKKILDGVK